MNKVLIYSNDLSFLKGLNNYISNIKNLEIQMCTSLSLLKENLEKISYILVIIDTNNDMESINYKYLSNLQINNIVLLYDTLDNIDERVIEDKKFILKEKSLENVKALLSYDSSDENDSFLVLYTKKRILNEIKGLKFEVTNIGVQYLIDCILLIKCNDALYNLEKDIYPIVAKKYNVTSNKVKWNIYSCINNMSRNNSMERINRYLGFSYNRTPTPKVLIFTIVNKI